MDSISFTTFLKIAGYSTTQRKVSEILKLHNGEGGYDFYKNLKSAAKDVALDPSKFSDIEKKILAIKRAPEREHNHQMIIGCRDWWQGLTGAAAQNILIKSSYKEPGWKFHVRLAPELVYQQAGERFVTYLWATKTPPLTGQIAAMGLYMLREGLKTNAVMPAAFQIRDLRSGRTRSENLITNQTLTLLSAEGALINSVWPAN